MSRPPSAHGEEPAKPREAMPPDIHNVYVYEVFNTLSWSIVLGSPMLLFYQRLDATATVLAIAACLAPVMNILQIPAAHFVERVGYRKFVLSGWTSRSMIVVLMMIVALLPSSVDRTTRVVMMLFLAFVYNVLRGISVCGFLPWFTHIVPESRRGEFLAKDQLAGAMAGIASLLISGTLLRLHDAWYSFGLLFAGSAAAAFVSLTFLRRVPDVPVEKIVPNPNPLPWREMFFYPPFLRYVRYNMIVNMALGASGVFWIRYFRLFLHVSESNILYVACIATVVMAVGLFMLTPLIDRAGNKPALTLSGLLLITHFSVWALVAAGVLPFNRTVVIINLCFSGLGGALWNLANVRMVMGLVPAMGRPHFLALYSVAGNLSVGLIPLAWGPIMDTLNHWHTAWGIWQWNSYSLFYCILAFTMGVGLFMLRFVPEPEAMTWDVFTTELLVKTPSRAVSRLIGRLRGPVGGMNGFIAWFSAFVIRMVGKSLRIKFEDAAGIFDERAGIFLAPNRDPIIACFWHNRTALMAYFADYYCPERTMLTFISRSRDGQFMTDVAAWFRVKAVRGSTSRHGSSALLGAIRAAKDPKTDIAITPDGPRGPRYKVQPGILKLAQATGRPIVAMTYDLPWKLELKSWDRFHVPLPFSRCILKTSEMIFVPRESTEADLEVIKAHVETALGGD